MPDLTHKQVASIRTAQRAVNLWDGAVSSGKTIGSLLAFAMRVADPPPGGEIVVIGRTRDSVGRNLFGPLQDANLFGPLASQVLYNTGASTAKVMGRKVHVLGASDARAEGVLRGLTVSIAYVDELTLISEEFWMMLLSRMRVAGARIYATTNPDGPGHWAKAEVVDRAATDPEYTRTHFVLDDNPTLPDGYVELLRRQYSGLWKRRFLDGEWVQAAGAIYDTWDPAHHVVAEADIPPMERIISIGVDHGTTNPTRGYLVGVAQGRLWVLREWAPPTGLTDAQQSLLFRAWVAESPWPDAEWVYVDPAAASFKRQLFVDGVLGANAHNDVLAGIRTVSSLLSTHRIMVSDKCELLIKFIPGYVWDPKKTKEGLDAPIKLDDHEVDALRYAVHSTRQLWLAQVPLIQLSLDASAVPYAQEAA